MKVAVRCEKHSPILGQHASWQTECSLSSPRIALVRKYSGETGARTLIQSGCFLSAILNSELETPLAANPVVAESALPSERRSCHSRRRVRRSLALTR